MIKTFLIICLGAVFASCAVNKKQPESNSEHVLFSEYSDIIDGNVTLILNNGTKFKCDTNDVTIHVDGIAPEKITWVGVGLGFKHFDRNKGRYLLIPNCNMDPKIIISFKDKNGRTIQLKSIELREFM